MRAIRMLRDKGVVQLARELDLSPSYISNLEAGRSSGLRREKFAALCAALGVGDHPRALMAYPDDVD
jgi:transcriptional regulator with XRE-family HTH domain